MEFHHVGISVSNLQNAIDFYRDMLGMELVMGPFANQGPDVERVMGLVGVEAQTGIVKKGSLVLEMFEFAAPAAKDQDPDYSVANRGISHFGMAVDNIQELYDHMVAHGVRFHAPVTTFGSGLKATYGRDLDGNVFEMIEAPKAP